LGGGFGGLAVARELERTLPRHAGVDVTLINRDNFFLFTPILHEIAASDLDITDIVSPLRKMLRRAHLFTGVVERIDAEQRTVHVSHARGTHGHDLPYDYLVIALGATTNFHGIAGLGTRALTMKSLGDAIELRNRLIEQLEEADFECAAGMRKPLCSFVVAGGGFAGVETVAAMNDFVRTATRFYRNLGRDDVRVTLVHSGSVVLPELGETLGRYTQMQLMQRGIDVVVDARVSAVDDHAVTLSTGRTVPASTIVWTADDRRATERASRASRRHALRAAGEFRARHRVRRDAHPPRARVPRADRRARRDARAGRRVSFTRRPATSLGMFPLTRRLEIGGFRLGQRGDRLRWRI
jgi:NADH:ubiquinone reductase (H+-translocating)